MHTGISLLRMCWSTQPYSASEISLLRDCLEFQFQVDHHSRYPTKDLIVRYLLANDGENSIDILFQTQKQALHTIESQLTDEVMREVRLNSRDHDMLHPVDRLTSEERDVLIGSDQHRVAKNMMGNIISLSYNVVPPDMKALAKRNRMLVNDYIENNEYVWMSNRIVLLQYSTDSSILKKGCEIKLSALKEFPLIDELTSETFDGMWPNLFDLIAQSNEVFSDQLTRIGLYIFDNSKETEEQKNKKTETDVKRLGRQTSIEEAVDILIKVLSVLNNYKNDKLFDEVKRFINGKVSRGSSLKSCSLSLSVTITTTLSGNGTKIKPVPYLKIL